MKGIKILGILFLIVLAGALASEIVASQGFTGTGTATFTKTQGSDLRQHYGDRLSTYYPILAESDSCVARQDVIIQVAPFGCEPAVVRSDLLAEQNVPIFCQLNALKVNPILDINGIRNIRFAGNYPPEVQGVGFHPARAAIRTENRLEGSPLIDNIGYAVVVLKKNPDEATLPEFVNMTLSATLEYEAQGALGVGRSSFLLREVSDAQWESESVRQSFLRGEYSARLIEADPNSATIAIYRGDTRISTPTVQRGRAEEIYVPGGYCQVALNVHYDGFISPEDVVRLKVDDDLIDVYEGSSFLNNKCDVNRINGNVSESSVDITCGRERFTLGITPTIFEKGEVVILTEDINKGEPDLWEILEYKEKEDKYVISKLKDDLNKTVNMAAVIPSNGSDVLFEAEYDSQTEEYFKKSVDAYREVAKDYPFEKKSGGGDSTEKYFGETALEEAIALSERMRKHQTEAGLISYFLEVYPGSESAGRLTQRLSELHGKDSSISGKTIEIDNKVVGISMVGFISSSKSSARFSVGGNPQVDDVELGESVRFNGVDGDNASLNIEEIEAGRVRVAGTCEGKPDPEGAEELYLNPSTGQSKSMTICGRTVELEEINLEEYAQVRIDPSVKNTQSQTDFLVGVGIEKRDIKLSPEKTQEKIDNLNESIKKWESISNNLGNVVENLKAACFATAGVLTVKNFFSGLQGEALARQEVMRGPGGWTEKCNDAVAAGEFVSLTKCYNEKSAEINADVNAYAKAIKETNEQLSLIENQHSDSSGGFFGGDVVNRDEASTDIAGQLLNECGDREVNVGGQTRTVREFLNSESLGYEQMRDMYRDCKLIKGEGSLTVRSKAETSFEGFAAQAYENRIVEQNVEGLKESLEGTGLAGTGVQFISGEDAFAKEYHGKIIINGDFGITGIDESGVPAQVVHPGGTGSPLLVTLKETTGGNYVADEVYRLNEDGDEIIAERLDSSDDEVKLIDRRVSYFKKVDAGSYRNAFAAGEARRVQYYETEPYKGTPALVPFDTQNGWYVATKQTLPGFGNIKSFESSGRPTSFWICNVGDNKKPDFFHGIGDDICRQFNVQTGQSLDQFPGLGEPQTRTLVQRAISALNSAAEQYGKDRIQIGSETFQVGPPASGIPGTQCQDFMSPEDCLFLFNVCDPVICPSSRCDLGGAYPVADVVQTGIVGSALLCLPNAREGIVAPVCLTGIKAGIDGYLSILKSHQACLQESLDTGQMVGICDQIYSVYMCEFFWRQAAPVANLALPKIVEFAYSGGEGRARGGGEYLTVQRSWDNAQQSVNFFTDHYAVNALDAFNIRSVEEAGTTFCQAFVSAKGPTSFKTLVESDSPPQFHAFFSEIPYSDVTVPATSQYKVFYHVFSGEDSGVQFSVYLKDPPQTSYYSTTPTITVATGFAARGQFATETKDFTAPAGYKELCVRVNNQEECGFGQVSTSFAVNYVRDEFVKDELTRTDINSESACISGSLNPTALLTPNIQEAAQRGIDPAIYNRGVVRICSTGNPGSETDPTRFVEVGVCDDPAVKCWLDQRSVDDALSRNVPSDAGVKNETLSELTEIQKENLEATNQIYDEGESDSKINDLDARVEAFSGTPTSEAERLVQEIEGEKDKVFWNHLKARLQILIGKTYGEVASALLPKIPVKQPGDSSAEVEPEEDPEEPAGPIAQSFDLNLIEGDFVTSQGSRLMKILYDGDERLNIGFFGNKIYVLANGDESFSVGDYDTTRDSISINIDTVRPEGVFNIVRHGVGKKIISGRDYRALEYIHGKKYSEIAGTSGEESAKTYKIISLDFLVNGKVIDPTGTGADSGAKFGDELTLIIEHDCSYVGINIRLGQESYLDERGISQSPYVIDLPTNTAGTYSVIVECLNLNEEKTDERLGEVDVFISGGEPISP